VWSFINEIPLKDTDRTENVADVHTHNGPACLTLLILLVPHFFIIYLFWTLTKRDRKQLKVFERKVHRTILGPVCDGEKQNWRILTNKEIYASIKKSTIIETIRLNRLRWFGHVQRMEDNRIPKRVLCMNLGTT
jgi:hypothetical protein